MACPPHTTAENIATFLASTLSERSFGLYLADRERSLFVAESDSGELVGYTMLVMGDPGDPDVAGAVTTRPTSELSKIYVHPDRHGAGLAAALLAVTLDEAGGRGASSVWLGVNQENERANRFYEKSGFTRVGTKRFLVGDRFENDFVRERIL